MATMANNDREITQPTCQNCQTSTTPLWRRDEMGAVLCNACGLFLKLHGRPRPISLKTDVIKSRNRVKTMRPDLAKQKKNQALNPADMNGADYSNQANGAAAANARRASQRSANGTHDDTNSPISRTGTPNMYAAHQLYSNIDDQFQTPHLPATFGVSTASDGRAPSPLNGELSRTHEQLIADNASLKTRVSELEVIQELYRGRIQQLEQEENARREVPDAAKAEEQLRAQISVLTDSTLQLHKQLEESQQNFEESQRQLEESHRRENMLKRRLDELEVELKDTKASLELHENGRAKKPRLDDGTAVPAEAEAKVEVAAP
ncbi:hypothetical protein B0T14DRAFT_563595 [Immersiella caudata]|uniref:GATA-type domain-containing protein n=1 Tax=Immersiella caudata TaxID=314043 RepID=A0AA39X635_9PEZI|nr:hypothetical protein B0T14DRAFT_563595 [Immersiella caudata]